MFKRVKNLKIECKHFERPFFPDNFPLSFLLLTNLVQRTPHHIQCGKYIEKVHLREETSSDRCISIVFLSRRLDLPGWSSYTARIPGRPGHWSDLQRYSANGTFAHVVFRHYHIDLLHSYCLLFAYHPVPLGSNYWGTLFIKSCSFLFVGLLSCWKTATANSPDIW